MIIEDEEIQKEESTPWKRTRLGRRQSELMENESAVESSCKTRETRSRKVSDMDEVMIVNEDPALKEPASLQTRTRRGRRLSELMENDNAVESPSKTKATRSRKISDIDEVLIIDEDPKEVQEDAASPPKRTRRGRRQSDLLLNENVVDSPSKTRSTRLRKILDIEKEAVATVAAVSSSPVKKISPEKSATSHSEVNASPPVKIALTKPKKAEEIVTATAQSEVEESPVNTEENKIVVDVVPKKSQSEIEKSPVETVLSDQSSQSEVTKSPVKIDLSLSNVVVEENDVTDASSVEGKEAKAVSQDVVVANVTKEDENLSLVESEDLMEVEEDDLSNKNLHEPSGEKEEATERDDRNLKENAVKSSIAEESVEAEGGTYEAVKEDTSVKCTEVVSSPEKTLVEVGDAVIRDVDNAIHVSSPKVVAEHKEIDQYRVVEEPLIANKVREETKDVVSEESFTIKDLATSTEVSSEVTSSEVNLECSPTKSPVKQTMTNKSSTEGNQPCDGDVVVEEGTAVAAEDAVVTIDEEESKDSEKLASPVAPVEAETLKSDASSAEEKEVDSDVFAEDLEIVKTVLEKASVGEEDEEDQNEKTDDADQKEDTVEVDQKEDIVEVDQKEDIVETVQEEEAVEAVHEEEVIETDQNEEAEEKSESVNSAKEINETALGQVSRAPAAAETSEISQTKEAIQVEVSALTEIDQSSVKVDSRQEPANKEKRLRDEDEEMVEIIEKTLLENESKNLAEESYESPKKPSEDLEADKQIENDVKMVPQEIETKMETNAWQDVEDQTPKDNPKPEVFDSKIVKSANQVQLLIV